MLNAARTALGISAIRNSFQVKWMWDLMIAKVTAICIGMVSSMLYLRG